MLRTAIQKRVKPGNGKKKWLLSTTVCGSKQLQVVLHMALSGVDHSSHAQRPCHRTLFPSTTRL